MQFGGLPAGAEGGTDQRVRSFGGQVTALVDVLGQPQDALARQLRGRLRSEVRIHHQQVNGVGADVQHAQSHAGHASRSGRAGRFWSVAG